MVRNQDIDVEVQREGMRHMDVTKALCVNHSQGQNDHQVLRELYSIRQGHCTVMLMASPSLLPPQTDALPHIQYAWFLREPHAG